jgi:ABC-type nitrate/sulfonate/bicarbonate transport system substrate-binding protein
MNRRTALTAAAAGVAAALGGCRPRQTKLQRLRVALLPRFTLAPLYMADELGYFAEHGIEMERVPLAQSTEVLPMLAVGKVDVAFTSVGPGLINAVVRGAPIRVVAARDVVVPGCTTGGTIFASAKAFPNGLKDLRQLRGKRVVSNNSTGVMTFFLDELLRAAGMTRGDLKMVHLRAMDGVAALLSGKVDALVAANLDKDLSLVSTKIVRSVSFAEVSPNFQYTFVLFGKAMVQGDRRLGVNFLAAYLRGLWDFQAGKTPKALTELALAAHSDPGAAEDACRQGFAHDGLVNTADVQRLVDWAVARGFCEKAPAIDQLVDNTMVRDAFASLNKGEK